MAVEERTPPRPLLSTTAPLSALSKHTTAVAAYLLALVLGLGVTAYMFPRQAVFATDIRVHPVHGYDAAVNVYGQRYFTKDSWHWPLLRVSKLGTPEGTNVAFTDGIPLAEIVVKLSRRFLPSDFHSVYLWLALCWVAQPLAAVFALRNVGERRLLPNLAVAVIAVSMPALVPPFVHAALCSHFLILIALGLYFRISRNPRLSTLVAAGVLMVVSLLVNPYIMEMVIAVLVAAPLSMLIRRDRAWPSVALGIGGGVAVTIALALLLGYGRVVPMGGFGTYSMNLLSPIYPSLPFSGAPLDATGGQYEGYQYLGAGVIVLLLLADFTLDRRERLTLLQRHGGLVFACFVLTFLALSTKIYGGHRLLLDLPTPSWLLELRSSGRLFWPVAYIAVITCVVIVCRKLTHRWAAAALLVFAILQFVETMNARHEIRKVFKNRPGYTINTALFRPLLANHSKLVVWPKFGCGVDVGVPEFSELYLLASEVAIPVNMTYVGRFEKLPDCNLPEIPISVGAEDLWVFVPRWNPAMVTSVENWRNICRQSSVLVVCAQDLRGNTTLPTPDLLTVPLGKTLSTTTGAPGTQWLASGWYDPESWGTWTHGTTAYITAFFDRPLDRDLVLRVWASAVAAHPSTAQKVTVLADGRPVATWDVKKGSWEAEYVAAIPAPSSRSQSLFLEFRVEHPIRPQEQGMSSDTRELGFGLSAFRFEER